MMRGAAVRALARKEAHGQMPVVIAALVLSVSLPVCMAAGLAAVSRPVEWAWIAAVFLPLLALIVWPLLAAATGASSFSADMAEGTLDYLLSLPIARGRVWSVKVVMAALATLASVSGTVIIAWLATLILGEEGPLQANFQLPDMMLWGTALGALALCFAMAVLCSTLMRRPMTAAAAAVAGTLGLMAALAVFWIRMDVVPRLEPGLTALQLLLLASAALILSRWIFVRHSPGGRAGLRTARLIVSFMLPLGLLLVTFPIIAVRARLSPAAALVGWPALSPSGDALVATASHPSGGAPRLWRIPLDGGGVSPLTPPLTLGGEISPDGRWAAYLSIRGWLGLRSSTAQIRVAALDGSDDRALADVPVKVESLAGSGGFAFSPDGRRLALHHASRVLIASLDGTPLREIGGVPENLWLLGWQVGGERLVLGSRRVGAQSEGRLVTVEARTGAIRELVAARGLEVPFGWRRPAAITFVPVASPELSLVDVSTGEVIPKGQPLCGGFDQQEGTMAWVTCSKGRVIIVVDGRAWATFDGRWAQVVLSPDRSRAAVQVMMGPGISNTFLVSDSGLPLRLEPGWSIAGWQGANRVVLMKLEPKASSFATVNATTGEMSVIFPRAAPPRTSPARPLPG